MKPTLAAKLARLKPTPIAPDSILAALAGQGELPADVAALARELEAEAATVAGLRMRLSDVPPAVTQTASVLL